MPELDQADGEALLDFVQSRATAIFGARALAVYAIGSLAHGGFSPLASDVDAAVILDDPLERTDADRIATIAAAGRPRPFGDRLSIFWGTPRTLHGDVPGGRFPPHDLLDLALHGRLLSGRDQRAHIARPTPTDLVVSSTEFALAKFTSPETTAQLESPDSVVAAGPRAASKLVLFPVRLLYTAQTGEMGLNEPSVAFYQGTHPSHDPRVALVEAAFVWRSTWNPADPDAASLLRHAPSLYVELVDALVPRLTELDRRDLVRGLLDWRAVLVHAFAVGEP